MTDYSNLLRELGLKATHQRLRVLDFFLNATERHWSADEVYAALIAKGSDIGLATVYRVLTQFVEVGLFERHQFESGKSVFELKAKEHHDHLVCTSCGHVQEFFDASLERRQEKIAEGKDFVLEQHALYLFAKCLKKDCPRRG